MRESINHVDFRGQTYGVTEDVRSLKVEFCHADGTVGMHCDDFVVSSRVLAKHMELWSQLHAENGGYVRILEDRPHFQRSQFPNFECFMEWSRRAKAQRKGSCVLAAMAVLAAADREGLFD